MSHKFIWKTLISHKNFKQTNFPYFLKFHTKFMYFPCFLFYYTCNVTLHYTALITMIITMIITLIDTQTQRNNKKILLYFFLLWTIYHTQKKKPTNNVGLDRCKINEAANMHCIQRVTMIKPCCSVDCILVQNILIACNKIHIYITKESVKIRKNPYVLVKWKIIVKELKNEVCCCCYSM